MSENTSNRALPDLSPQHADEIEPIRSDETDLIEGIVTGEVKAEELQEMPPEIIKEKLIQSSSYVVQHSGPLPYPSVLRGYEDILPGAAERIIQMAEKEQEHRFEIDEKCQHTDSRDSLLGILGAIIMGLACLGAGVLIAKVSSGATGAVFGAILGASGIAAIVGTFLRGTKVTWKADHTD